MVFTVLEIKTNIHFKSFKTKKSLHVNKSICLWGEKNLFPKTKNLSEESGSVLHFCKSIVSLNRRQLYFHIYFCIQCVVIGFGSSVKKIWLHTDMLLEKGRAF